MKTGFFLSLFFGRLTLTILVLLLAGNLMASSNLKRFVKAQTVLQLTLITVFIVAGIDLAIVRGNNFADSKPKTSYAIIQDTLSASKQDSTALLKPFSLNESVIGQVAYMKNCHMCHGVDRMGASAPSLYHLNNRVTFNYFKNIVSAGRAQMPGFRLIDDQTLIALYKYLSDLTVNEAFSRPVRKSHPERK